MALDLTAFGRQLKNLRKLRGLTQPQLAEELRVSPASVSNWERAFDRNGKPGLPRRENILAAIRFFRPPTDPNRSPKLGRPGRSSPDCG